MNCAAWSLSRWTACDVALRQRCFWSATRKSSTCTINTWWHLTMSILQRGSSGCADVVVFRAMVGWLAVVVSHSSNSCYHATWSRRSADVCMAAADAEWWQQTSPCQSTTQLHRLRLALRTRYLRLRCVSLVLGSVCHQYRWVIDELIAADLWCRSVRCSSGPSNRRVYSF